MLAIFGALAVGTGYLLMQIGSEHPDCPGTGCGGAPNQSDSIAGPILVVGGVVVMLAGIVLAVDGSTMHVDQK